MLCKFQDPNCRNFFYCPFIEEPMEEYGDKGVNVDSNWVRKKLIEKHIESEMENLDIKADFTDSRVKTKTTAPSVVKLASNANGLVERAVRLIQESKQGNRHATIYGQMWMLMTKCHINEEQISYIRSQIFDYEKLEEFDSTVNYLRSKVV